MSRNLTSVLALSTTLFLAGCSRPDTSGVPSRSEKPQRQWAKVSPNSIALPVRNFALLIGVGQYEELGRLPHAIVSAEDVANVLTSDYGYECLILKNATRKSFEAAFDEWLRQCQPTETDNILLFYSGHGRIGRNSEGYLATRDSSVTTRNWIEITSIVSRLQNVVANKAMVLDCCYSGAMFRADADTGKKARSAFVGMSASKETPSYRGGPAENLPSTFTNAVVDQLRRRVRSTEADQVFRFPQLAVAVSNAVVQAQGNNIRHEVDWGTILTGHRNFEFRPLFVITPPEQDLVDLICEQVKPESWKQSGGFDSISMLAGQITVSAPVETHRRIQGYHEQLNKAAGLGLPASPVSQQDSPEMLELDSFLDSKTTLSFIEVPLSQALSVVSDGYEIALISDVDALNDWGVTEDVACSIDVSNVTVRTALKKLLEPFGLQYLRDPDNHAIVITTPDAASDYVETRVYDFQELLRFIERDGTENLPRGFARETESGRADPLAAKIRRRAVKALNDYRFKKAVDLWTDLIEEYPSTELERSEYYASRGEAYSGLSKHRAALKDCDEAIRLDPANIAALETRAFVNTELIRYREAITDYQQLLSSESGRGRGYISLQLARVLMHERRFDDAIQQLDSVASPENEELFRYFAKCLRGICREKIAKGQLSSSLLGEAEQDYRDAMGLIPEEPWANSQFIWLNAARPVMGYSDSTLEQIEQAAERLRLLSERGERKPVAPVDMPTIQVPYALAAAAAFDGDTASAEAFIESLDENDPARFTLATLVSRLKKHRREARTTP